MAMKIMLFVALFNSSILDNGCGQFWMPSFSNKVGKVIFIFGQDSRDTKGYIVRIFFLLIRELWEIQIKKKPTVIGYK